MADFLNGLTSRIFEVFLSVFLHQTTVKWLNRFSPFLVVLILGQSERFANGIAFAYVIGFVRLLIFKIVSFLKYLVFLEGFLAESNSNVVVESFSHVFGNFNF